MHASLDIPARLDAVAPVRLHEAERSRALRASDQRRYQRVTVSILGRYMLSDRREFPCQTVDMSPGGVRLTCAVAGRVGERVVLYLEHIGRIEGIVARLAEGGFAVELAATVRKRDKIASQLTWLANRELLGLPEGRTHERFTPKTSAVILHLVGQREVPGRIIDLSMSGAAIACSLQPPIGALLTVGRTPGRSVRHFEGGFGVQFLLPLSADRFHEGMIL